MAVTSLHVFASNKAQILEPVTRRCTGHCECFLATSRECRSRQEPVLLAAEGHADISKTGDKHIRGLPRQEAVYRGVRFMRMASRQALQSCMVNFTHSK